MRTFLLCSLVLLVAMPVFASKEIKELTNPVGTRGLLDCTGAVELILDAAAVAGDNTGLPNNAIAYSCVGYAENGGDEVWYFTLASETNVTITMTPNGADLDLFLLGSCDEDDCIDYSGTTGEESITACLAAGTYYVAVDGYGSTYPGAECPYTIGITGGTCPTEPDPVQGGETCAEAVSLCDHLTNGAFSIAYDCTGFADDYDESNSDCGQFGSAGADMVYSVCLEAGGTIDITQTGQNDMLLWMVTDCVDLNTCVASSDNCCTGADEFFTYTSVAGGTYYIIVDSYTTSSDAVGTIFGTITDCCVTATENSTWGTVKQLFR